MSAQRSAVIGLFTDEVLVVSAAMASRTTSVGVLPCSFNRKATGFSLAKAGQRGVRVSSWS